MSLFWMMLGLTVVEASGCDSGVGSVGPWMFSGGCLSWVWVVLALHVSALNVCLFDGTAVVGPCPMMLAYKGISLINSFSSIFFLHSLCIRAYVRGIQMIRMVGSFVLLLCLHTPRIILELVCSV